MFNFWPYPSWSKGEYLRAMALSVELANLFLGGNSSTQAEYAHDWLD